MVLAMPRLQELGQPQASIGSAGQAAVAADGRVGEAGTHGRNFTFTLHWRIHAQARLKDIAGSRRDAASSS